MSCERKSDAFTQRQRTSMRPPLPGRSLREKTPSERARCPTMVNEVISLHSGEALHQALHVEFSAATPQPFEGALHRLVVLEEFPDLVRCSTGTTGYPLHAGTADQ